MRTALAIISLGAFVVAVVRHRAAPLAAVCGMLVMHSVLVDAPVQALLLPIGGAASGWWWWCSYHMTPSARRLLALPVVLVVCIIVIEGLAQSSLYSDAVSSGLALEPRWPVGEGEFRARGTTGHPLPSAALAITLLVGLVTLLSATQRKSWVYACVALVAAVAVFTGTRTALLSISVVIITGAITADRQLRKGARRMILVAFAGLTVAMSAVLVARISVIDLPQTPRIIDVGALASSESVASRASSWDVVVRAIADRDALGIALGDGKGSLGERARDKGLFGDGPATADNSFLTIAYELGMLGLSISVATVLLLARTAVRAPEVWRRGAAIVGVSLASFGLTFDIVHWSATLWIMGAVAAALSRHERRAITASSSAAPARRSFVASPVSDGRDWIKSVGNGSS